MRITIELDGTDPTGPIDIVLSDSTGPLKIESNVVEDSDMPVEVGESNQPKSTPFVEFDCKRCGTQLAVLDTILPGDAAVVKCENCQDVWCVVCKPLDIMPISEADPKIWEKLSDDPFTET